MNKYFIITILSLMISMPAVFAQLAFAKVFSDNMIFQRNKPLKIWGNANPNDIVAVHFNGEVKKVKTKPDSTWLVTFRSQQANSTTQEIIASTGKNNIRVKNILIGDVWVCIGQSNMEWPLMKELHYQEEKSNCNNPLIRLYNPVYAGKNTFNVLFTDSIRSNLDVNRFYQGFWQVADSNAVKLMSAVAYYFGKSIIEKINVPIGLINLSIGGAPLETFISADAIKLHKKFNVKMNGNWIDNNQLPVWVRERGKQNIGIEKNGYKDAYGSNHAFKPGFAFESGIKPLMNSNIKGIICYQGESNAQEIDRVKEYGELSLLMINHYRKMWKQPDLPFYFVQLSSIDTVKYKGQLWPEFRNAQRNMLQLIPYSGMAVSSDAGFKDDVHPTNKKIVGERLALLALNKTYHQKNIPSGPLPISASYKNGKIIVHYKYAEDGLQTSDNKPLREFSLDGKNEVNAKIDQKKVVIKFAKKPMYLFYGWKPFTDANLVNKSNLPASTFKIKIN